MKIIKYIGNFLLNFVFRSSLFFGLTLLSAVLVLTNANTLKDILNEINAHERFTQSVIDLASKNQQTDPNALPVDYPEVKLALNQALDKSSLVKATDTLIDSAYSWLEGDASEFNFSIDFTQNKKNFSEQIANFAVNRVASLETCIVPPVETSVFKISCRPPGTDLVQLRQQVLSDINSNKDVFAEEVFTQNDLPKTQNGKDFAEAYSNAPKYYSWFKLAPFALLTISLLCAITVILTSRTRRIGLKKVGTTLLGTAVIMAITPLIYVYVLPALGFRVPSFGGGSESVSAIVNDATTSLYSTFNIMLLNVAVQTAVVGVVILMVTRFIKQNSSAYSNLECKSGLSLSESKKRSVNERSLSSKVPLQTSEVTNKKPKKNQDLSKKYKKL